MAAGPRDEVSPERFLVDAGVEKLRSQSLTALADAARGAVDDLGPDRALPLICSRLLRAMDCTTAVLSLIDAARDSLVSVAGYDVSGVRTKVGGSRSLSGDAVVSRVVNGHEPLFSAGEPGGDDDGPEVVGQSETSSLALPLVLHGQSIGMIELLAGRKERTYTSAELILAQGVGAVIAQTMTESRGFAKYRHDPLEREGAGKAPDGRSTVERTLTDIAQRLTEGLEVQRCDVLIRQEVSGAVKVVARYDMGGDDTPWQQYGLGDIGARARAAADRCVVYAHDDDLELPAEERAEMVARGQRAVMYVPIVAADEVVGFLCAVESRHSRRFTKADDSFATRLAGEAGVAVASARVVDQLHAQNQELRLLLETGAAIASSVDLRATLSTIAERLAQTLGVAWSNVYDYHADSDELEVIAYYQVPGVPSDSDWLERRFTAADWPEGLAAVRSRTPQVKYYDYSTLSFDDFAQMAPWGEKATLSLPLVYGGTVLGVLDVAESRYPRRFTDDELRLAAAIGSQAAVAIHNARLYDEATRRNAELETFLDVAATLSSTADRQRVLGGIARRLREALGSNSAEVYEYVAGAAELRLVEYDADEALDDGDWRGVYELAESPLLARCIERREAMVVRLADLGETDLVRADMVLWGDASELWVPMVYRDRVLGLITAADIAPNRRYSDREIRLAAGIASQAAAALENARGYERLDHERASLAKLNARLSAFTTLTGQMRGLVAEDKMLELLGRIMSEALGFNQWVAYLYDDPDGEFFNVRQSFGGTPEIDEHYRSTPIPASVLNGLVAAATRISQSFFVDHMHHTWSDEENFYLPGEELVDDREPGEWDRFDSLFVPMIGQKGQLIGYIEAYDPRDRQRPTEDLVQMIEVFAGKAASNIELQRAYDELAEQTRTDGLTGLYNHRFFQEKLIAEVTRAKRFHNPLTLLMIDVDNFKDFNDTYGHPEGDRLLRALAELLLAKTRVDVDFVARYGGEEFVVLLPETDVGDATLAAERLHDTFEAGLRPGEQVAEAIRRATEEQTFATTEGERGQVTVSVGIAAFPDHAATPDQLVANADKALYLAKRLGKNRTCVYGH